MLLSNIIKSRQRQIPVFKPKLPTSLICSSIHFDYLNMNSYTKMLLSSNCVRSVFPKRPPYLIWCSTPWVKIEIFTFYWCFKVCRKQTRMRAFVQSPCEILQIHRLVLMRKKQSQSIHRSHSRRTRCLRNTCWSAGGLWNTVSWA